MNVVIEMKLYILFFFQTIAYRIILSGSENLQSLPLLQLHSPFQLVVLDGRIANCHYTAKIITSVSKLFTIVDITIDITNSFI